MKRFLLYFSLFLCLGVATPAAVYAQDDADDAAASTEKKSKKKKKGSKEKATKNKAAKDKTAAKSTASKGKLGPVAAVLDKLEYVTDARPNLKAKTYKYIQSATWCRFCNLKMPEHVERYKNEYKKQGIEIILVSADDTVEKAKAFMEKYNAPFPCVMRNAEGVADLPQFKNSGGHLPSEYTVAADGTLISDGSPMRGRKD